jgi:transcriptional regulator of met regulon
MDALAFILFIGWPLSLLIAYSRGGRDRKRRRITNVRGVTNNKTFYEAVNHHVRHAHKLPANPGFDFSAYKK